MLTFKSAQDAVYFSILHPTLREILFEIVDGLWIEHTGAREVIVTELWRSREETIARYRAAGLPPPAASVHEQVPCRGADLSVRNLAGDPLHVPGILAAVNAINNRWQYEPGDQHQVALYHSVSGPHVHVQVRPGNETRRRS